MLLVWISFLSPFSVLYLNKRKKAVKLALLSSLSQYIVKLRGIYYHYLSSIAHYELKLKKIFSWQRFISIQSITAPNCVSSTVLVMWIYWISIEFLQKLTRSRTLLRKLMSSAEPVPTEPLRFIYRSIHVGSHCKCCSNKI